MRGSITIFFSLVFVVVVSVLGTTIESARWACAKLYWKQAAQDSIRSVFGDFCIPLFEEYGVLFLDESYGQKNSMVIQKTEEHLLYNMNPNYGNIGKRSFLYKGNIENIEITNREFAIDGYGSVFKTAAYNHMKYRIPANLVENFLKQFDFINQTKIISSFFSDIQEIQEDLSDIDAMIISISDFVEEMKTFQEIIDSLAMEVNDLLTIGNPDEETRNLLEMKKKELLENKTKVFEIVNMLLEKTHMYKNMIQKAEGYLEGLADEWIAKTNISQNMKDIVIEEIEYLLMNITGESDAYGIGNINDILESLYEEISIWVTNYTSGRLEVLDNINVIISREDVVKDELAEIFNAETLLKEFKSGSFYSLICPDYETLSEAEISPFDNRAYANERAQLYKNKNDEVNKVVEDIVFQEYICQMFGSFSRHKDNTAIKYETEYMICGKRTDKENINAVINELLAIREAINLAFVMSDLQKKNEAHALAMACLGYTGVYAAVKVLQYLILTVWAFGEAMIDVRIIMSGGSVPVVKTEDNWMLELKSLLNMAEVLKKIISPEKKTGFVEWCYEDYLKLLLYMQNKDEQVLRVMDVIEANIQKNYSACFKITNCVSGVKLQASFYLKPLFKSIEIFDINCRMTFGYSY